MRARARLETAPGFEVVKPAVEELGFDDVLRAAKDDDALEPAQDPGVVLGGERQRADDYARAEAVADDVNRPVRERLRDGVDHVDERPRAVAGVVVGAGVEVLEPAQQRAREARLAVPAEGDGEAARAARVVGGEAEAERPARRVMALLGARIAVVEVIEPRVRVVRFAGLGRHGVARIEKEAVDEHHDGRAEREARGGLAQAGAHVVMQQRRGAEEMRRLAPLHPPAPPAPAVRRGDEAAVGHGRIEVLAQARDADERHRCKLRDRPARPAVERW